MTVWYICIAILYTCESLERNNNELDKRISEASLEATKLDFKYVIDTKVPKDSYCEYLI